MQKINELIGLLTNFEMTNKKVQIIYLTLTVATIIFVFLYSGGEIFLWKIIAKIKSKKIKKLNQESGICFQSVPSAQNPESLIFSSSSGNFLKIYFSVEASLKNIAERLSGEKSVGGGNNLINFLKNRKVLNNYGVQKIKVLRWISRKITGGRIKYIENIIMKDAIMLVWKFHQEINAWMRNSLDKKIYNK